MVAMIEEFKCKKCGIPIFVDDNSEPNKELEKKCAKKEVNYIPLGSVDWFVDPTTHPLRCVKCGFEYVISILRKEMV
ncbi:MAG: hypothetical protein ABII22_01085 [Candidatus Micrarchaeota archaeon]